MTDEKKQEMHFTSVPTIEITDEESRPFWNRSPTQSEQPVVVQEKSATPSSRIPKLLAYIPPDTLMFPLFSAIQRKAWGQAKKLSHELLLCDPERRSYRDLYVRIERITNLNDQRIHPRSAVSEATTASSNGERSSRQRSD